MLHDLWRLYFAFIGHFSTAVSFFIVEPEIQSVTTDQSVLRGSSVKLRCSANGVPAPTVVWTKNGSDVVLIKAESTAILFLKNVTKQHHEGVYHCAINNTEGRDDADVNIKVVGKFTIAPEKWLHCERVGIACVAKRNLTLVSIVCEAAARSSFPPADSTNYQKSVWGEGYVCFLSEFRNPSFPVLRRKPRLCLYLSTIFALVFVNAIPHGFCTVSTNLCVVCHH